MTDFSNDSGASADSPSDDAAALISEQELNDALTQASLLATELSAHLGEAEAAAPQREDQPLNADEELDELERLVANANAEIEEDAAEDNGPTDTPEDASGDAELGVPDFMSEFTQAPEPEPALEAEPEPGPSPVPGSEAGGESAVSDSRPVPTQAAPAEPAPVPKPKRGVATATATAATRPPESDTTGETTGRVGTAGPVALSEKLPEAPDVPHEADAAESSEPQPGYYERAVGSLRVAVINAVEVTCVRIVDLLEWIDRPFARLNDRARLGLGWLALATGGTALIVLLLSLA